MAEPTNKEERLREIVALAEETVRLFKEMIEGFERQIAEWKRLAEGEPLEW